VLFNSFVFIGFFLLTYGAYLLLRQHHRAQNLLLLGASYVFYGYWDWRFLGLLALSTGVDFVVGRALFRSEDPRRRKLLLTVSVCTNLGILGFFKYYDFFAESLAAVMGLVGLHPDPFTLGILLPVGISFYTFQTMSYTIDIYRGKLQPVDSLTDFALFVAFFPQLVAGPIERAVNLLPQIARPRRIDRDGVGSALWLILWGYFKKVVIADRMALIVNPIFAQHGDYQGLELVVGLLAFTVQIYGDFSGYTDIARGLARLMGFELMVNFKLPYFAINPSDFWLRWHVSLSSWLRDYLYIPLGGNRGGVLRTQRNLAITMLLGGLWHGAAWHFVIWGGYHGALLAIYRWLDPDPIHADPWRSGASRLRVLAMMALMFSLTVLGWLIFRAESAAQILEVLGNLHRGAGETGWTLLYQWFYFSWPLIPVQILQYRSGDLLAVTRLPLPARLAIYGLLFCGILAFGVHTSMEFIYFQF
jgi:alginate O-acetyltransferase complex protein AlgI